MRESHQPELRRALEEGVWSDGEPLLHAFTSGAPVQQPDRVRIRAWAEVADHFTIADPRCVDALSPFYVWTPDYAEKRLGWRRHQPLHVLLLRTYRIPRPVTVKVKDEYTAAQAWIELQRELPFEGTPVLSDAEFERASEEIRSITSEAAGRPAGPRLERFAGGRGVAGGGASASRAASAPDSGTRMSRGPAARKSGTSKPPERRDMLGMPSSSSSASISSDSGWLFARRDLDEPPFGVLGLDLARLSLALCASRSLPGHVHQRHLAIRAEALACAGAWRRRTGR